MVARVVGPRSVSARVPGLNKGTPLTPIRRWTYSLVRLFAKSASPAVAPQSDARIGLVLHGLVPEDRR